MSTTLLFIVLLIGFILAFGYIIKSNINGYYILAIISPFADYEFFDFLRPVHVIGVFIILTSVFKFRDKKLPYRITLNISFIIFIILITYATVVGGFDRLSLTLSYFGSLLLIYFVFFTFNQVSQIEKFFKYFFISNSVANVIIFIIIKYLPTFHNIIYLTSFEGVRLIGFSSNPNFFAGAQAIQIILALYFLIHYKGIYRLLALSSLLIALLFLVMAQSRGALIGIFISLVIFILTLFYLSDIKKQFRVMIFMLFLCIVAYFSFNFLEYDFLGVNLARFRSDEIFYDLFLKEDFSRTRYYIYNAAFETIYNYPFGIGFTETHLFIGKLTGIFKIPHNFILSDILDFGIIGGFIWLIYWSLPILKGLSLIKNKSINQDSISLYLIFGLLAYLLISLTHSMTNWIYLWLYWALLFVSLNLIKMEIKQNKISNNHEKEAVINRKRWPFFN